MEEQAGSVISLCTIKEKDNSCLESASCFPSRKFLFTFSVFCPATNFYACPRSAGRGETPFTGAHLCQRYKLHCKRSSTINKRTFWLASHFGHHLRHLSVKCDHHYSHVCRIMSVRVRKLLKILRCPSHLTSFRVAGVHLGWASPATVSDLSSIMTNILMKVFEMPTAHWLPDKGQQVLDAVFQTSRNSLETLRIDDYFHRRKNVDTDWLTAGLTAMTRLTKLSLNYVYLMDDGVITIARAWKGELKNLKLWSTYVSPIVRFISHKSWSFLTDSCPALKVQFKIVGPVVSPSVSIPAILNPALRVSSLKMSIADRFLPIDQPGPNMSSVLHHISKYYRKSLRKFEMDIDNHGEDLDTTALIQLVVKCRSLDKLTVMAILSDQQTDKIVQEIIRARRYLSVVSRSAKHLKTSNASVAVDREAIR